MAPGDRSVGPDPDGTGGPHALVDDVTVPVLTDQDRHHLAKVVRVRDGDPITVGDGRGSWRTARFGTSIEPTGDIVMVPAPLEPVTVGFALVKGSRIDDTVRHLTELGVDVIVPFSAQRCVVRWDGPTARRRHERLVRISVEAAMQSRRAWLPTIEEVSTFAELNARAGAVVAQMGAAPLDGDTRLLLVGPEGGFAPEELAVAKRTASIGAHVLRAETAALVAGALLCDRRGVSA